MTSTYGCFDACVAGCFSYGWLAADEQSVPLCRNLLMVTETLADVRYAMRWDYDVPRMLWFIFCCCHISSSAVEMSLLLTLLGCRLSYARQPFHFNSV